MPFATSLSTIMQNTLNFFSKKPQNAEIVSRARQYSGEYSRELPFASFYIYYHQTPSVQRNINSIHKRWMGSSIEVRSKDPAFDAMWKIWSKTCNFFPKMKEMALDCLITGTGLLERQYYQNHFANIEHVPTKTLWRIYRDEFGQVLAIWQLTDGDTKELAPKNIIIMTINNPEREAVGKSEMYAVAVPQRVGGKVDSLGNPINAARYLPSILDVKTRLNFAHMEILEKQAKSRWILSFKNIKDRERQKQIENDLENEANSKYVTVTDAEVSGLSLAFPNQMGSEKYQVDMDRQIDQGTGGFPGEVMDQGGSMGYASSQTPVQDLSLRIEDMQNDLSMVIQDEVLKPLCEEWGFDYARTEPELVFNTFVEKITFEQAVKLLTVQGLKLTDIEQRNMLREFLPGMEDDKTWEEFKKNMQAEQQKMAQQQGAKTSGDSRPDVEKNRPKPEKTAESDVFNTPGELEKMVERIASRKIKEFYGGGSYFAMPPVDGKPYTSPDADVTDPETMDRIKQMLADVKAGKMKQEDAMQELDKISKEADNLEYWIKELTQKHPTWKRNQVIAVAYKKVGEDKASEFGTPHNFEPSENPLLCKLCTNGPDDLIHQVSKPKKTRAKKK